MGTSKRSPLASRLREARAQAGLTQDELARRVGVSGRSAIGKYETGEREPDYNTLAKMAAVLQVSVAFLLGEEGAEQKPSPDQRVPPFNPSAKNQAVAVFHHVGSFLFKVLVSYEKLLAELQQSREHLEADLAEESTHPVSWDAFGMNEPPLQVVQACLDATIEAVTERRSQLRALLELLAKRDPGRVAIQELLDKVGAAEQSVVAHLDDFLSAQTRLREHHVQYLAKLNDPAALDQARFFLKRQVDDAQANLDDARSKQDAARRKPGKGRK
ncbi:MAG TPA: helix-turn-helix transcriptional regulator [Candidatus Xenobia bacterium]